MARSSHLAAQRRELTFILNRLTAYTTLADREVLELRLRRLLDSTLPDDFYAMADDVFEKIRLQHPAVAEEARGVFFGMLSEVKYEYRTETEHTSMLMVGLMMSTVFQSKPPVSVISQETADAVAALLKKHYINPKARITVFHEMLRSNQGPANNTETGGCLTREMARCGGTLYTGRHLDVPECADDPIISLESERGYGLYLRHLVITVTVPAGELAVVHPYRWWDTSLNPNLSGSGLFDPNQILQNPFALEMTDVLAPNLATYHTIVTEPFPIIRGLDFLEQVMSPFRVSPLVMNAIHTTGSTAAELCASIAFFCSRPDAAKIYANEIRIAIALKTDRNAPFSGDCISMQDNGFDMQSIASNLERFLNMLGISDVVFHEEPRYFETEDEGGRIYVNASGVSTPLGVHGTPSLPPHFLN